MRFFLVLVAVVGLSGCDVDGGVTDTEPVDAQTQDAVVAIPTTGIFKADVIDGICDEVPLIDKVAVFENETFTTLVTRETPAHPELLSVTIHWERFGSNVWMDNVQLATWRLEAARWSVSPRDGSLRARVAWTNMATHTACWMQVTLRHTAS